ncbi:uncharacterized protein LOC131854510 [Achroia grisella]|uniref:uncharacterized protein LOC131854510 n=1 Tax=Achroia grisella TaxID=688607 RepID=UPI0027D24BB3|nr:uncharacterized protein LOC131854510 [Achroia grisella]
MNDGTIYIKDEWLEGTSTSVTIRDSLSHSDNKVYHLLLLRADRTICAERRLFRLNYKSSWWTHSPSSHSYSCGIYFQYKCDAPPRSNSQYLEKKEGSKYKHKCKRNGRSTIAWWHYTSNNQSLVLGYAENPYSDYDLEISMDVQVFDNNTIMMCRQNSYDGYVENITVLNVKSANSDEVEKKTTNDHNVYYTSNEQQYIYCPGNYLYQVDANNIVTMTRTIKPYDSNQTIILTQHDNNTKLYCVNYAWMYQTKYKCEREILNKYIFYITNYNMGM